jgi:hypothetical protein
MRSAQLFEPHLEIPAAQLHMPPEQLPRGPQELPQKPQLSALVAML